jgi:hypothetical protein
VTRLNLCVARVDWTTNWIMLFRLIFLDDIDCYIRAKEFETSPELAEIVSGACSGF